MAKPIPCLELLIDEKFPAEVPEVVVAFGDEPFLRREAVTALLGHLGLKSDEVRSIDGDEAKWIDVHDELATMTLFSEEKRRVAVVSNADRLIKDARPQLEKWCAAPAASSLLILQAATFPSNTKLYKLVEKHGLGIACTLASGRSKSASPAELKKWIQAWGAKRHGLQLITNHASQILEAVGSDTGVLHQELGKLALFADSKGKLTDEVIRSNVGSWRTRTMWEIADAIVDGKIEEAWQQLERVFSAGEHPAAVVPQISWSLRRFGTSAHLILQGRRVGKPISAQAAIGQSGFWGNDARLAEPRLRRLGLRRASEILHWLVELDLKIKGSHSHPERAKFALEELCLRFL